MMLPVLLATTIAAANVPAISDTALLTFESGVLVGADWIQRRGSRLRTLALLMQSGIRDATIELREDGTAVTSATSVSEVGQPPGTPVARAFDPGVIAWSDQIPSSIELAVLRARALGQRTAHFPGASLYRDTRTDVEIDRIDSTDWVLTCNHKRYEVLTDAAGQVLSATLPDYGVTLERRIGFNPGDYPPWPPNSAAPGALYRAEEVRISAPEGHVLAGTLTVPRGTGPFPAAVLITGLSPSNRNGGVPPWMPLRDLADALSRHGVVVLRVDDRGEGQSTGDHSLSTTFDEANDVEAEVRWLRAQSVVDPRRVMLVGYSEGGLIAPMVAARDSAIAGIVTLAGPGVSGPEVARYQIEAAVTGDTSIAPSARAAEIEKQLADTLTAREKSYLGIDPFAFARRVRCPALVLQGGSDRHVPLRSAEKLAWAMRSGGNRDVSVRVFPGVSHSFLPDPIGLSSGWAGLPGFMTSPQVLEAMTRWMGAHVIPPAPR
jgi:dienelactone hydrolase